MFERGSLRSLYVRILTTVYHSFLWVFLRHEAYCLGRTRGWFGLSEQALNRVIVIVEDFLQSELTRDYTTGNVVERIAVGCLEGF